MWLFGKKNKEKEIDKAFDRLKKTLIGVDEHTFIVQNPEEVHEAMSEAINIRKKPITVVCKECKCLGYKEDFKEVAIIEKTSFGDSPFITTGKWTWFYCLSHKLEYDKVISKDGNPKYYKLVPEHYEEIKLKTKKK